MVLLLLLLAGTPSSAYRMGDESGPGRLQKEGGDILPKNPLKIIQKAADNARPGEAIRRKVEALQWVAADIGKQLGGPSAARCGRRGAAGYVLFAVSLNLPLTADRHNKLGGMLVRVLGDKLKSLAFDFSTKQAGTEFIDKLGEEGIVASRVDGGILELGSDKYGLWYKVKICVPDEAKESEKFWKKAGLNWFKRFCANRACSSKIGHGLLGVMKKVLPEETMKQLEVEKVQDGMACAWASRRDWGPESDIMGAMLSSLGAARKRKKGYKVQGDGFCAS